VKVCVFQIGARRHYAVPRGLHAQNALAGIVTTANADSFPWSRLPSSLTGNITRRTLEPISVDKITPLISFDTIARLRRKFHPSEHASTRWARQNELFGKMACRKTWPAGTEAVYCYNGAGLEIFRQAKRRGLKCILDQTAAAWRYNTRILTRELEQWREWEPLPADIDPTGQMIEREEAEWQLADAIVCGSPFVVDSIADVGGPVEKCRVVPYPIPEFPSPVALERPADAPIRVLFLGTLQLRKGIQHVWQAARDCDDDFEFLAIGPSNLTTIGEERLAESVKWNGKISRADVSAAIANADVFLLPTLSEGSANVCLEALALGKPVVTTRNSGLGDYPGIVWIQTSKPDAIVPAIRDAIDLAKTSYNEKKRSVDDYGRDLVKACSELF